MRVEQLGLLPVKAMLTALLLAALLVSAKTIKIYDPLQDPELYDVTFFSEAKFDSWLGESK
jgi:hypothetical protein